MNAADHLALMGVAVPQLLFPNEGIDLAAWAVIACDQHTQDRFYWEQVKAIAEGSPSSLYLIYPEVYLEEHDKKERITAIHTTMKQYLQNNIFSPQKKTFVYIERDTPYHVSRRGLLVLLDLEEYDWQTTTTLIRPTEGTLPLRLPPRMEIRRTAPLETPHILVLLDDAENTLFPCLGERAYAKNRRVYDTELMLGGGRVRGWELDEEDDWEFLAGSLEKLTRKNNPEDSVHSPFLFAVGDGNHSLAAAKGVWEEYKNSHMDDPAIMNHPARWALVELENLYDPALSFEPIHRVLFGSNITAVKEVLARMPGYSCRKLDGVNNSSELIALVGEENCRRLRLGLISQGNCFLAEADPVPFSLDSVQPLLDTYSEQNNNVTIDYIHGSKELFRLTDKTDGTDHNAVGVLLPPFRKQGFFETIAKNGPLPRKSFSMGESCEKRYYLECRKLF